jgi:hypothetical protein|eukprot:SAG25_NODE_361_length_9156_cov_9.406647_11_plen_42_part_00
MARGGPQCVVALGGAGALPLSYAMGYARLGTGGKCFLRPLC